MPRRGGAEGEDWAEVAPRSPLGSSRPTAVRSWCFSVGIGPIPAIRRLMGLSGRKIDEIETYEINEAFAAQASYCVRDLGMDPAKVKPNGGAIVEYPTQP